MSRKLMKKATETSTDTSAPSRNVAANVPPMAAVQPLSFSCSRKELLSAVKHLSCIADRKSCMPMLRNIALRGDLTGVVLAATDLNVYSIVSAPAWGVHARGSATVPAKQFADVLGKLPDGEITVRATMRGVEIVSGAATVTLDGLPARDFPKLPAVLPDDSVVPFTAIDAAVLKTALGAVDFAICRDETRFHLNGVRLEYGADLMLRTIATDGHRLVKYQALCDRKGDFHTDGLIIPAKGVKEIKKLLGKGECEIALISGMLAVRYKGTTLVVKPIDAQFPPYEQVIPKDYQRLVTVDRKAFLGALGRAALVCTSTRGVRLEITGETSSLTLASTNPDSGEVREALSAESKPSGDAFKIGVNPRYLIDALEALASERVTLSFDHGTKQESKRGEYRPDPSLSPIVIRTTEDAVFHKVADATLVCVVMPMRVD